MQGTGQRAFSFIIYIARALHCFPEQKRIVANVDELFALCDQLAGQVTAAATNREQLLEAVLAQAT